MTPVDELLCDEIFLEGKEDNLTPLHSNFDIRDVPMKIADFNEYYSPEKLESRLSNMTQEQKLNACKQLCRPSPPLRTNKSGSKLLPDSDDGILNLI